ncbi:glycosyltransferase [Winogradskyella vincentii]|uniref:Glycosyltransferase n=1 Tax=Winogradskyella vincentii TaxID=2877122 RepID=A0ABS7XZB8_9FLAO|nr:glycosyltransferase [Winogradskyella vincentii]MCA0152996.1 glycosyltransferase [Winogradskyella vincentii]
MESKIKIILALPKLTAGGAERVVSFVAQNLNKEKFDVTLLIVGSEKDNKYDVSNVKTIYLDKNRVRNALFAIIKEIYKIKPQIVLSSISDLNVVMGYISMIFKSTKFIGRHTFIISDKSSSIKKSNFNFRLFGLRKLDYFICQSFEMQQSIVKHYDIKVDKLKIINNPITNIHNSQKNHNTSKIRKYITVGRLIKLKGHIRLLNILKRINHPFVFTIIGSGNYKSEIFNEVNKLDLKNYVKYIEFTNDVDKYLIENDFFLQGSYSEGFPNALLESCAVGTPVIAFDVPGGTKEIVDDGINGYLVNNEDEFIERLNEKKIWNHSDVKESVEKKFGPKIIIKKYEDFFIDILSK